MWVQTIHKRARRFGMEGTDCGCLTWVGRAGRCTQNFSASLSWSTQLPLTNAAHCIWQAQEPLTWCPWHPKLGWEEAVPWISLLLHWSADWASHIGSRLPHPKRCCNLSRFPLHTRPPKAGLRLPDAPQHPLLEPVAT